MFARKTWQSQGNLNSLHVFVFIIEKNFYCECNLRNLCTYLLQKKSGRFFKIIAPQIE